MTDPAIIEAAARVLSADDGLSCWEPDELHDLARAVLAAVTSMIEAAALERAALLRDALKECSDELAEYVEHHYPAATRVYPSEQRRYDRDMEPVLRARALITKDSGDGD